jgi:uncharacterized protein (UPF0276 family)
MNSIPYLGYGLGLRSQHWEDVLNNQPCGVDWFEIISENFMLTNGYPQEVLKKVRASYPVVMHGVSLSIGSHDPIDMAYLKSLKQLADWLEPAWISDHICWTGINRINSHDLLPVPYTEASLAHMVNKVDQVQNYLGRKILLENPSNYMEFSANTLNEWDFIKQLLTRADCMLLLDINNIYVTCFNHNLDPKCYIDAIPATRIGQVHLAGHEHHGNHIIDTHNTHINEDVLALYAYTMATKGCKNTMIEWDSDIPAFSTMLSELDRVRDSSEKYPLVNFSREKSVLEANHSPDRAHDLPSFKELMNNFQSCVLDNKNPGDWVSDKDNFSAAEQLNVYQYAYRKRLFDAIVEDYPQTRELTGGTEFDILIRTYIEHTPSTYATLEPYIQGFADFLKHQLSPHAEMAKTEAMISELRNQPQTKTVTLEMIAQMEPANLLNLKLRLGPMTKLAGNTLYVCDKLQVYRQELTDLENEGLQSIDQERNIGDALQRLYERDLCTASNALTALQTLLKEFVPKGIFVRPEKW